MSLTRCWELGGVTLSKPDGALDLTKEGQRENGDHLGDKMRPEAKKQGSATKRRGNTSKRGDIHSRQDLKELPRQRARGETSR